MTSLRDWGWGCGWRAGVRRRKAYLIAMEIT
jgi:hypothetical protein